MITSEQVVQFWNYMHSKFSTSTIDKSDATEMQIVAEILDKLGITDKQKFLTSFTTTIGRRIYTPFTVGVESDTHDFWSQIVVCVHEHQHVVQHDKSNIEFEFLYLTSKSARAMFEVEAYRCNLEMHFWRYGHTTGVKRYADLLHSYGCDAEDINVAMQSLLLANVTIRQGIVSGESTAVALEWLNANMRDIVEAVR